MPNRINWLANELHHGILQQLQCLKNKKKLERGAINKLIECVQDAFFFYFLFIYLFIVTENKAHLDSTSVKS